ncbi:MAG: hypothetical protein AAFU74_00955 [Bacteroidota bacterium]
MNQVIIKKIKWENIEIEATYKPNYFASAEVSHLEIRSNEVLPITETGYRSIFLFKNELENTSLEDFILDGLDKASKSKDWQDYIKEKAIEKLQKSQLSLF